MKIDFTARLNFLRNFFILGVIECGIFVFATIPQQRVSTNEKFWPVLIICYGCYIAVLWLEVAVFVYRKQAEKRWAGKIYGVTTVGILGMSILLGIYILYRQIQDQFWWSILFFIVKVFLWWKLWQIYSPYKEDQTTKD